MAWLIKYTSAVLIFVVLFSTGCDQQSQQTEPKMMAAQALEYYFKNESTLKQTAWSFYATQNNEAGLYAYLVFPQGQAGVARMAPVESELRRLCPDSNYHTFWGDTELETFELVLVKNVQADKGKAKRLLQITCDSSFDLIAFENGPPESTMPEPIVDVEGDRADWYKKIIAALNDDDPLLTGKLVNERPQYIDIRNDRGESLLHFCKSGATASLLLDKGAKVDAKTQWGGTPLIYAADFPRTDFATALINAGADVNHVDNQSATPLKNAYNLEMAMLLIEHGAVVPKDALLSPARFGRFELVKYLHGKGANIDAKNGGGQTALHRVAVGSSESDVDVKDHVDLARWLIQQGADVNALDRLGETPYDATIWHDKPNQGMLKLLSDHGGKPAKMLSNKPIIE